ncbi:MAG: hypothetical protein IJS01_05840 [Lentisphaeria bacterium]|nr:hypothetical protein [Lentisphaeria bacterium]
MHLFLSRRTILLTTGAVAAAVRAGFFCCWLTGAFRFFHRVPGLDMETLLRFSEWGGGCVYSPLFVVHRFLIYLVWLVNGRQHCVEALVICQSLFGVAGAVMTADIVLRFWGRRGTALAAGLFYALYGPLVLYDFCILQESVTTTLILAGVWAFLACRSGRGRPEKCFGAGLLLGLGSVGRPVAAALALFLPGTAFFRSRKGALCMAAGVFILWGAAGTFNLVFSRDPSPFFRVLPYTVSYNAEKAPPGAGPGAAEKRLTLGLPGRAAKFFLAFEMPENLNYYFLRRRLTLLGYLPGPGLLMPLALAGFLLMTARFRRREGLLLSVIVLLALPLAAREPIGRYRLHLVPYFIVCAAYFFSVLRQGRVMTNVLCGGAFALALFINFAFSTPAFIRASDHTAWALALEHAAGGRISPDSLREFAEGWRNSGFTDRSCGVSLVLRFLRAGDLASAARVCGEGISGPAKEKSVYRYYLAVIFTSVRRLDQARRELDAVRPEEIPELAPKLRRLREIVCGKN